MTRLPDQLTATIEGLAPLDRVGEPVAVAVRAAVPHGGTKDLLSGTWLGHPLHPVLTSVPIGAWVTAGILDLVGSPAADGAIAVGLAAVPATAAAGLADWSDLQGETQRVGVVHGAANVTASLLYLLSLRARRRGHRGRGRALGFLGLAAVGAGGFLGGHLTFRRGVGVDHTFDRSGPDDWTDVAGSDELADGSSFVARAGDDDVLLVRRGAHVDAISDRCTHLSGPLHDGRVEDGCVTCPWHQSTFRLDDGSVVHGPATAPQPRYEVREADGRLLVRRA
ncbi:MAG: Rieske (2Fe-2S) protein [Actinomycetia bacterium]|nr:Rieske (2Fe-2S) protein [Actinomycetes bacterium]